MVMMQSLVTWARWSWRTLTSMRTALVLLMLLAIAAVPGSVFPQRGIDDLRVANYIDSHGAAAKILDALGFFEVYTSVWFAAIYLLLLVSLVGCVVPRALEHGRAMRAQPPAAPRHLDRLEQHQVVAHPSADVFDSAKAHLRSRRFRIRTDENREWVSAEKGFIRETGNLVFHFALIALVVAIAVGKTTGSQGRMVLVEGQGFTNQLAQYDDFRSGVLFDRSHLRPFALKLADFDVAFQRSGPERGAPSRFDAHVIVRERFGAADQKTTIRVNHPLTIAGSTVFLTSHGYAPHFTVRDAAGAVVWSGSAVFAPEGANLLSRGVVKAPDAKPQLGFQAIFAPSGMVDRQKGLVSTFPDADAPLVFMGAFSGDLGMDTGLPQNVFALDVSKMKRLGIEPLRIGDVWTLPDKAGSISFDRVDRWAAFVVSTDRTEIWVLIAALMAVTGLILSLLVPRRRVFLRIDEGRVTLGGLHKSGADTLARDLDSLAAAVTAPSAADDNREEQQ
ncbi:MAG: hypothetical protein RL745_428 [Actinomycetota bacterium]|jgi:cytochrome c biogenesis protein